MGADADHLVEREFKMEQTEIGSSPTTDIGALGDELLTVRRTVAAAAGSTGVHVVAVATSPFKVRPHARPRTSGTPGWPTCSGSSPAQQLTCGQHIHVSIDLAEEGVAVARSDPWRGCRC